jgi:hypothetical protein
VTDLAWPSERARAAAASEPSWFHADSNRCLDFHGDPQRAQLAVFSDGNHHMALAEVLGAFLREYPAVDDIFYTTTPPAPLLEWLAAGCLHLGNLRLSVVPQVFIGPAAILDRVVATGRMVDHRPFARSLGNVLLVRRGNPRNIRGIADLTRADVRLFLSNPEREAASYQVYADTLRALARAERVELRFLGHPPVPGIVYGERIHHREAPQALADDRADVAVVYHHLALRYTRIFPELFEVVPLAGAPGAPSPSPDNVTTTFHAGLVDGGGKWGRELLEFLAGPATRAIYESHGLAGPA